MVLTEGCAPPLGLYEIKPGELRGAASFDKSDRFRPAKPGWSLAQYDSGLTQRSHTDFQYLCL